MHHEEDPRLWLLGTDEPASDSHAAEDEVDQGEAGFEQCVFLVFDDLGVEHDVFFVCTLLGILYDMAE
jgi:hypothetical protein